MTFRSGPLEVRVRGRAFNPWTFPVWLPGCLLRMLLAPLLVVPWLVLVALPVTIYRSFTDLPLFERYKPPPFWSTGETFHAEVSSDGVPSGELRCFFTYLGGIWTGVPNVDRMVHLAADGSWVAFLLPQDIGDLLLILFPDPESAAAPMEAVQYDNFTWVRAGYHIVHRLIILDADGIAEWKPAAEYIASRREHIEWALKCPWIRASVEGCLHDLFERFPNLDYSKKWEELEERRKEEELAKMRRA